MQPSRSRRPHFLLAALAAIFLSACLGKIPGDRSALRLTLEREDGSIVIDLVVVTLGYDGGELEDWGFFTGDFPATFELWTALEGRLDVTAVGYECPGGDCRGVEGRADLVRARGTASVELAHGRRTSLTVALESFTPGVCGNGVVEGIEACDTGGVPSAGCMDDCSFTHYVAAADAGGRGDSFAAFLRLDGAAVAWTEGAGDETVAPDGLLRLDVDLNGVASGGPVSFVFPSCTGAAEAVLDGVPVAARGRAGREALLLWTEAGEGGLETLCLGRTDAGGIVDILRVAETVPLPAGSPIETVDGTHAAAVSFSGSELVLHVVDLAGGSETGRAVLDEVGAGASPSSVDLVSPSEGSLVAAWRILEPDGTLSSKLMRWRLAGDGGLVAVDASPLLLGVGEGAWTGEIVLATARQDPSVTAVVRLAGGNVEALWIEGDESRADFGVCVVAGAASAPLTRLEDAAATGEGTVHVMLDQPLDGGGCRDTLLRLQASACSGIPDEIGGWMDETAIECRADLVSLGDGRSAVFVRFLAPDGTGEPRGDILIDIVR
jgi:hypothetical protein